MTRQDKQNITGNMARHPKVAARRIRLVRMLGSILHEVEPTLAAMREADMVMDTCTSSRRGAINQGCTYDLAKYGARECRLVAPDSDNGDIARSNDIWQSVRVNAMDKAQAEISPVLV
jgi:hypothetical protein